MINDFLSFRRMLAPVLIVGAFWVATSVCIITGLYQIFNAGFFKGLSLIFFGPLIVRLACESLIIFFRMNETLTEIKNKLP